MTDKECLSEKLFQTGIDLCKTPENSSKFSDEECRVAFG